MLFQPTNSIQDPNVKLKFLNDAQEVWSNYINVMYYINTLLMSSVSMFWVVIKQLIVRLINQADIWHF